MIPTRRTDHITLDRVIRLITPGAGAAARVRIPSHVIQITS
jgi:hypothetical protein